MINFLKQAEFKVFACSVLSLCQSQVWSCFEIWLPKSSLCTEKFALSPAKFAVSLSLLQPSAQSTSGPNKKVPSVISKVDLPASPPLSRLCATESKPVAL